MPTRRLAHARTVARNAHPRLRLSAAPLRHNPAVSVRRVTDAGRSQQRRSVYLQSSALVDDDVAHGCRRPGGAPMAFCSSAVGRSSRMSRWLSVQRASALTAVAAHDDRRTVLHVVDVAVELRLQFLGGDRSSCCGGRRRPPRARRFGDVPPLEVGRGAGGRKPAVHLVDTETDDRITGFRRGRRLQAADGGRAAADQAADVGPIPVDWEHGGRRLVDLAERLGRTEGAVRQRASRLRAVQLEGDVDLAGGGVGVDS